MFRHLLHSFKQAPYLRGVTSRQRLVAVPKCSFAEQQNKPKDEPKKKKADEQKKKSDEPKKKEEDQKKKAEVKNENGQEKNEKGQSGDSENVTQKQKIWGFVQDFNLLDKLGEAKDSFDQYRTRRQQKQVQKKMAFEIKEREKYDKMSDEEKQNMEHAIKKEFEVNLNDADEVDYLYFMYFTQSNYWDRIAVTLQLLKCRLFHGKELARKQEIYETLFVAIQYNPNQLNQSLPLMHEELQKIFEAKLPDYYTKTRWELYKQMKHRLDRQYGSDSEFEIPQVDENGIPIEKEIKEEEQTNQQTIQDPDEASQDSVSQEQIQERLRVFNQFQTQLAVITDEPVIVPTKKNQQVNQETIALERMKKLDLVGWDRTETIKNYWTGDKELYYKKTLRHEWFCIEQEMNAFLKSKEDINMDTLSEEQRLTMFSVAKFDPAEMIRRKLRLTWLRNQKKFGFGYNEGDAKNEAWIDLSIFSDMKKSKTDIKESTSGIKEAYDDQVSQSSTSAYAGTNFLLQNTTKNNSMEKCLDFIRQYDKEFSIEDLDDFIKRTFERVYISHLKGMLYEIDNICQEQAIGYFKAVWNIWTVQKLKPKYHRVWGIEKPVFSSSEINEYNQPVFNFQIHCQTNHCFVDNQDGTTLKEGSDARVMRNGYQVVCIFDPVEENEEDQWKIISISPIEKTLLLA